MDDPLLECRKRAGESRLDDGIWCKFLEICGVGDGEIGLGVGVRDLVLDSRDVDVSVGRGK